MAGGYRRKKTHKSTRLISTTYRLRNRRNDLDQAHAEVAAAAAGTLPAPEADADLPGAGQHRCLACDRHFVSAAVLRAHEGTRAHKRRVRALAVRPYSTAEADAAGGLGSSAFYAAHARSLLPAK